MALMYVCREPKEMTALDKCFWGYGYAWNWLSHYGDDAAISHNNDASLQSLSLILSEDHKWSIFDFFRYEASKPLIGYSMVFLLLIFKLSLGCFNLSSRLFCYQIASVTAVCVFYIYLFIFCFVFLFILSLFLFVCSILTCICIFKIRKQRKLSRSAL